MYKTVLVKDLLQDGERLVEGLDRQGVPITAALWYCFPLSETPWLPPVSMRWRLVIASPLVDTKGPLAVYRIVLQTLKSLSPLRLSSNDIAVWSPSDANFRDLRSAVGRGLVARASESPDLLYLVEEDAYVYRWPNGR